MRSQRPVIAHLVLAAALPLVGCSEEDPRYPTRSDASVSGDTTTPDDSESPGDATEGDTTEGDTTEGDTSEPDAEETDSTNTDVAAPPTWGQRDLPFGEDFVLKGVWGISADEFVAVGQEATIIEYRKKDGTFELVHTNTELDALNAVWGSAPDDVWAVGAYGAILHKNESGWNVGAGCSSDAACDDDDACTEDTCVPDGGCSYEPTGLEGCCGTTSWTDDFDGGFAWTVVDTSAAKTGLVWNVASLKVPYGDEPRATSGNSALYFGDPNAVCTDDPAQICQNFDADFEVVSATATSQDIALPKAASVTLRFDVLIDTESSDNWDLLKLNVKEGVNVKTVWAKADVGGPTGGVFVPASADLTDFAGKTVKLIWIFDSVDGGGNQGEGVYIDSMAIESTCGGELGVRFPTLFGVYGFGRDNAYAVGNAGTIIHWDGQSWKRQTGADGADLYAIGGSTETLIAGGANGEVVSTFGGGGLSTETAASGNIRAVATLAGGQKALVVGDGGLAALQSDGAWTPLQTNTVGDLHAVATLPNGSAFVFGAFGTALRWDGSAFATEVVPTIRTLYAAWSDGDLVWAAGAGAALIHHDGTGWQDQGLKGLGSGSSSELRALAGLPGIGPIVAAGGGGTIAERDDAGVWTKASSPTTYVLHGAWAASQDDVFLVGNAGLIVQKVDGNWKSVESPTDAALFDVWGRSASEVYAVGAGGALLRYDGVAWKLLRASTAATLRAVWGAKPDDVFAVGEAATIMHFDGLFWSLVPVRPDIVEGEEQPITDGLFDVGGAGEVVYAAGTKGTILEKVMGVQGPEFQRLNLGATRTIRGVAVGAMALFVGGEGSVLDYETDRGPFNESTGSVATLYDVFIGPDGRAIAVGDLGTVLERTPGVHPPAAPAPTE